MTDKSKPLVLYADMAGGAAGDMIVGAMIDCGLPLNLLQAEIGKLALPEIKLSAEKVMRRGVGCVKFNVTTFETHHHRNFSSIRELIERSGLSEYVKLTAEKIFRRLAEAEAEVHGTTVEEVHFHEVGAADSIADIVCAAIGLEYFGTEGFYLSDFVLGTGTAESAHGIIPVPAPATALLVRGYICRQTSVCGELTTPTGAAILTACSMGKMPSSGFTPEKIGYGAGSRQPEGIPQYFRLWTMKREAGETKSQDIVIEVNLDDMAGEMFPFLMDRLFEAGALDVFFTPVYMKKRRPATMVTVTAEEAKLPQLGEVFFRHSTTIGLRWYPVNRWKLEREIVEVETIYGRLPAKKVEFKDKSRVFPEYEACRNAAEKAGVTLFDVYQAVYQAGEQL